MSATMAEELRQMCRREPFQPFRVYTRSGETFDVLDAYECLVASQAVVLPVRTPSSTVTLFTHPAGRAVAGTPPWRHASGRFSPPRSDAGRG